MPRSRSCSVWRELLLGIHQRQRSQSSSSKFNLAKSVSILSKRWKKNTHYKGVIYSDLRHFDSTKLFSPQQEPRQGPQFEQKHCVLNFQRPYTDFFAHTRPLIAGKDDSTNRISRRSNNRHHRFWHCCYTNKCPRSLAGSKSLA